MAIGLRTWILIAVFALLVAPLPANAQQIEPTPEGASVSIVSPVDGGTVQSPVRVVMVTAGLRIAPAGEIVAGTGHHHLIIDDVPPPLGQAVPKDETHLHFGGGQTEASLELSPGTYTITAQVADGLHRSYGPGLAHKITVTVR